MAGRKRFKAERFVPAASLDAARRDMYAAQANRFFELLTHDDRGSTYIVAFSEPDGSSEGDDGGGRWSQSAVPAHLLPIYSPPSDFAVFVTRNGFSGSSRRSAACRQINSFLFDIDAHGGAHEKAVPAVLDAIDSAIARGTLPRPTMTVNTGRGVQVYYVLDRSIPFTLGRNGEPKGHRYFKDVEAGLARTIAGIIAPIAGVSLDGCVYDYSRVSRVPGCRNVSADTRCTLHASSDSFYNLGDLKPYCTKAPKQSKTAGAGDPVGARRRRRRGLPVAGCEDAPLLLSRLHAVERLQKHRGFDCVGDRELMCFVYYNTATQLYGPTKALEITGRFNGKFAAPLPDRDIAQIASSVDGNTVEYGMYAGRSGFYPLSAQSIVDKLQMTEDEMVAVSFFGSKRSQQRISEKLATRARREARNERIRELFITGARLQDIADKMEVSKRTVSNVLAGFGLGRDSRLTPGELFLKVVAENKEPGSSPALPVAISCHTGLGSVFYDLRMEADDPGGTRFRSSPPPPPSVPASRSQRGCGVAETVFRVIPGQLCFDLAV